MRIREVSSCDVGAGENCKVLLMKRHSPTLHEAQDEVRKGNDRMVSRQQVSDALFTIVNKHNPDVSYGAMMKVARIVSPGNEDDATAFSKAYTGNARIPNGNALLSAHLQKQQVYGGSYASNMPHEDEPSEDLDGGSEDATVRRPTRHRSLNATVRRDAVTGEDDSDGLGRDSNASKFGAVVDQVARGRKITRSQAIDHVLREGGEGAEYYRRSMLKSRSANSY
jgi:hypothetical protein